MRALGPMTHPGGGAKLVQLPGTRKARGLPPAAAPRLIHVFPRKSSCKMAARWGTGEEMLKSCNTQMFSPVDLDEVRILVLIYCLAK